METKIDRKDSLLRNGFKSVQYKLIFLKNISPFENKNKTQINFYITVFAKCAHFGV